MRADEIISKLRDNFLSYNSDNDSYVAKDNDTLHDLMNNEAVNVREISGQETWVFDDGSFVTRLFDEYWPGEDIDFFELGVQIK